MSDAKTKKHPFGVRRMFTVPNMYDSLMLDIAAYEGRPISHILIRAVEQYCSKAEKTHPALTKHNQNGSAGEHAL